MMEQAEGEFKYRQLAKGRLRAELQSLWSARRRGQDSHWEGTASKLWSTSSSMKRG